MRPAKLTVKELIRSFWVNPIKHSDYGFAWWSRFLIFLSSFMFTSFRLPFIVDRLHLEAAQAANAVFMGMLVYALALVHASYPAGWLSDRTGHRKLPVALATVLFAIGTYMLVHVETVGQFYVVETLLDIAFGIYASVDMALVLEVLPNATSTAKDLGVLNMANAAPQCLAPFAGAWLLTVGQQQPPTMPCCWGPRLQLRLLVPSSSCPSRGSGRSRLRGSIYPAVGC